MSITSREIPDQLLRELHAASKQVEAAQQAPVPPAPAFMDGMESPLAAAAPGNGTRASSEDYWGACSLETFADASPLSLTHDDASGWLAYLQQFHPYNFWMGDGGVQVWAYEEDYDNWQDTYGADAVMAFYHSGHGTMLADGRFGAPLGAAWGGSTWAWSDRMRLGNEQARYLFWSTCLSLRVLGGHNPIRTWSPANLGFRMLFGYETISYDNANYGSAFWKHWKGGKSFSTAFLDASWYDISTHQAPSVVACGANATEASDRLYNERSFSWAAVSHDWWQWRWYNAAAGAGMSRPARFELPTGAPVAGRLARRRVDESYAAALRSRFELDVPATMQSIRYGAGQGFAATDGAARLTVEPDGTYEVVYAAAERESTAQLAPRAAVRAAADFAAQLGLGEGELVLDRVLLKSEAGGTEKGDGHLTAPRVVETVVQFTQQIDGIGVLSPGAGQVSVGVDNEGTITSVRDTTRPVAELGARPRRMVAAPGAAAAQPDLVDVRRALDGALERQMKASLLRGGLPVGVAEVPGTAEIGYVMAGDEAVLTARRDVQVDCGSGLAKRYRLEVPIAG
jgi:hypothetical protein